MTSPIFMPKDTRAVLLENAERCDSRSLFMERFARPGAKDQERREWFDRLVRKQPHKIDRVPIPVHSASPPLYAQLQSRLMVNMAGGVMENAGLCIDRFGMPYIPGSAVKGCARRLALAALREWCESGQKPGSGEDEESNLFRAACVPFETSAEMLTAIAFVFGWTDGDWEDKGDFVWACRVEHASSLSADSEVAPRGASGQAGGSPFYDAARLLAQKLGVKLDEAETWPWKKLPSFAGTVSFLPTHPLSLDGAGKIEKLPHPLPGKTGDLELDVVTVHHKEYYNEPPEPKDTPHSDPKWQEWKRKHDKWKEKWGTAPDIEDPVPNVFPAVAPGHVFAFGLLPLGKRFDTKAGSSPNVGQASRLSERAESSLYLSQASCLSHARTWLATGLEVFGLGAKTNAGYGWFQDVTKPVSDWLTSRAEKQAMQEKGEKFDELSDDAKLEFIIELSGKPELCRTWRQENPATAQKVEAFANEIESPLP